MPIKHGAELDAFRANPLSRVDGLVISQMVIPRPEIDENSYTCKHFDHTTRDCGIYEMRPAMCRDYPYGRVCKFEGCSMKEDVCEST